MESFWGKSSVRGWKKGATMWYLMMMKFMFDHGNHVHD